MVFTTHVDFPERAGDSIGLIVMGITSNDAREYEDAYNSFFSVTAEDNFADPGVTRWTDESTGSVIAPITGLSIKLSMTWGPTGLTLSVDDGAAIAINSDPIAPGDADFVFRIDGNKAPVLFRYVDLVVTVPEKSLFWTTFRGSHEVP